MSEVEGYNFGEPVQPYQEFAESDVDEIKYVLQKFDGDFDEQQIRDGLAGEPVETLVVINGELVEHIINGESVLESKGTEGGI